MRDLEKYRGVIPAFYACYDEDGEISAERTEALALHFLKKGVKASMSTVLPVSAFTRVWRIGKRFSSM